MSLRSSILLFNSRGTCARCLGSRRRFNVNMGFADDGRIRIENLYIFKGYSAKKLIREFPAKLGFKLTELITELFEYLARLFCVFLPCIARRNCLKNFTVLDIMISMHMLYHITKGIHQFVASRVRYISIKYH